MITKNQKNINDLISIIIPAFKAEKYLEECLLSLFTQSYLNIEVVIVIEKSDFKAKKILTKFCDKNIQIIEEEKNLGPAHTRNIGIKHSNGKFISFCDADDYFKPKKLEEQIKLFSDNIGLVYSDFYLINDDNDIIDKIITPEWNFDNWIKSGYIFFSSIIVKKIILESVGLMDEKLTSNEDFDLLIKLSKLTEFKRTPKLLAYRRIHSSNLSKNYKTLISRYYIYKKYNYNFLAIYSLIHGFIFSNIFYFIIKHESLYSIVKRLKN